jgi:hypothetical protein
MSGDPRKAEPADVAAARAIMEQHYGEVVRPVSQVCNGLAQFVSALVENDTDGPYGPAIGKAVREYGGAAIMFARKSNLLWRLLYLDQPLRTKKCPKHNGRWSGYLAPGETCECAVGLDITGWLP